MKKTLKKQVLFLIIIGALLFGASIAENMVKKLYDYSIINSEPFVLYFRVILEFIVYSVAGMVFGFENLYSEMKSEGFWKINKLRLIIFGIPSFFVGTFLILYYLFESIPSFLSLAFVNFHLFISFMQMFFGYALITSFHKSDEAGVR